jgi:hypothetical protein
MTDLFTCDIAIWHYKMALLSIPVLIVFNIIWGTVYLIKKNSKKKKEKYSFEQPTVTIKGKIHPVSKIKFTEGD